MSSNSLPFFKFFADSWLSGRIQMLSMEHQGIFINLVCLIWRNGGNIEVDEEYISHILRIDKQMLSTCLDLLLSKKICLKSGNLLSVAFLTEQLDEKNSISAKRSISGRKGGLAKAKQMPSK